MLHVQLLTEIVLSCVYIRLEVAVCDKSVEEWLFFFCRALFGRAVDIIDVALRQRFLEFLTSAWAFSRTASGDDSEFESNSSSDG